MYAYTATSPFELSVPEGASVHVLEEDDGSGWVKVSHGKSSGLVPASYVELGSGPSSPAAPQAASHGSGVYGGLLIDNLIERQC